MSFAHLGLMPALLANLQRLDYQQPDGRSAAGDRSNFGGPRCFGGGANGDW